MNRHIFISYARQDQPYVQCLAVELRQRGFEVWLDDRIDFGERWWRAIVQAIRGCAAVIVVMTPEAEESEWVEKEILLARREQKPILPLLRRGQEFSIFVNTQYIDVSRGEGLPPPRFYGRLERLAPPQVTAEIAESPVTASSEPELVTPSQPAIETAEPVIILPPEPEVVVPTRQPFESELVLIPAGEFLMGSDPQVDKDARKKEQPQHRLYLPDYYIGKTPVTNAQYAAFVQQTDHRQPSHWKSDPPPDQVDHPVIYISWDDAVAYCRWLSQESGRLYRLPTEAEWEKAARGEDGRIYPWGNEWDPVRCNTREGGPGGTTPVGSYPDGASPYGVLDMAGNVWEWCATKVGGSFDKPEYKPYPYDTGEKEWSEAYLKGNSHRVLRGGSWDLSLGAARCVVRFGLNPYGSDSSLGFRVVSPI